MQFQHGDEWVELHGEENGVTGQVALQSLFGNKPYQVVKGLFFSTKLQVSNAIRPRISSDRSLSEQEHEVNNLLTQYQDIFKKPRGLPPPRKKEHAIILLEGQGPINVRPYRYPNHHKNEIEKQMK